MRLEIQKTRARLSKLLVEFFDCELDERVRRNKVQRKTFDAPDSPQFRLHLQGLTKRIGMRREKLDTLLGTRASVLFSAQIPPRSVGHGSHPATLSPTALAGPNSGAPPYSEQAIVIVTAVGGLLVLASGLMSHPRRS